MRLTAGIAAARAVGLRTLGVGHTYPLAALTLAEACVERLAGLDLAGLKRLFPDERRETYPAKGE